MEKCPVGLTAAMEAIGAAAPAETEESKLVLIFLINYHWLKSIMACVHVL